MKNPTWLLAAAIFPLAAGNVQGALFEYQASLSWTGEAAPVSGATGFAQVDYDSLAQTLHVSFSFAGLNGTTTAAHLHAPTAFPFVGNAGVATTVPRFAGFPVGVTSGTYDNVLNLLDASSFNPAFVTANGSLAAAEAALAGALAGGQAYLNIHTTTNPGGEIRGFLVPVPEASTAAACSLLSLSVFYGVVRRRLGSAK